MTFFQIIKQDFRFYRRTSGVTLLLAAVCCAILTGAMLVGDSVQHTLRQMAEMRLGEKTQWAMATGDRFFRQELAEELERKTESLMIVPVLALNGILESPDGSIRVNDINVYGVNGDFIQLKGPLEQALDFAVSQSLWARLEKPGEYLLRLQSTSQLSNDMIFTTDSPGSQAWSIKIDSSIPDNAMGRFGLQASQEPPLNVFVPIDWLAEKADVAGKANMLLAGIDGKDHTVQQELSAALKEVIQPKDIELKIYRIGELNLFELRTSRIFLDKPIAEAAIKTGEGAYGIFTYFVNEIRSGQRAVPYSTVSAVGQGILVDLAVDEIVINEWLADELEADEGDTVELTYFQLADTRKLIEKTSHFTVKQVVPMMGSFADPTLMPDYPGLTEADSCGDWDSGIPMDLDKIRDRDEAYWDKYKGTPKAFVSMETAQTIWSNRFGTATAVRWPGDANDAETIAIDLMKHLDLSQVGFQFDDIRAAAQNKASGSTDFAGLFAGLSLFLIFSAAVLLALMFVFYVESRVTQTGLLLAIGWDRWRIFALFLAEGACIAFAGCVAGAIISVLYTAGLIFVLNTSFWAKSLASLQLTFYMNPATLIKGIAVGFVICIFAIQLSLYHRVRRPVHQLLTGITERYSKGRTSSRWFISPLGWICLLGGIFISLKSGLGQGQVGTFFAAGTLCLTGLILIAAGWLRWLRLKSRSFVTSLNALAVKSIPRRSGRSIAVLVALACGVFMVIGVGASYKEVGGDIQETHSGTGGFALLARTTLPVTEPLELDTVSFVPMRLYQQDDASCLNLNRAQEPTLLGVRPNDLAGRDAFTFRQAEGSENDASAWQLLETEIDENTIAAIGDYSTIYWGLGKRLGDVIAYKIENGRTVNLKIVGILKESTVQGRLFISEDNFVRCFPSVDGYQQFFVAADWQQQGEQAKQLMQKYRDFGMEVLSSEQILAQFHEVENTYLAIFLVLGGLGLVLGSAGLGLVVALNVIDRRGELAMMHAVGFRKPALRKALFVEHGLLLLAGLFCGAVPALWAVLPSVVTRGGGFPYVSIVLILIGIAVSGMLWIRISV
ncbi:MAG: FtsX-like permease family protein, partial [Planctomycetota bacterium]